MTMTGWVAGAVFAISGLFCPRLESGLEARLEAFRDAGFPGAVSAVVLPDGHLVEVAVGLSDTVRVIPMRTDHRLFQGSVGKTYFATLAHLLVEEGRLDLQAPISDYLPARVVEGLPNGPDIRVHHLLRHTSGLVRYEFNQDFLRDLLADPDRVWRPEEQIAYLDGDIAPFDAGDGWEYSDTNYIVLGMILEAVTGRPAYESIERRLLEPLALDNTIPSDRRDLPGLSQGYAGPANAFGAGDAMVSDGLYAFNPGFEWAGGGFISTAGDLARWSHALYGGSVLGEAGMERLFESVPAPGLGRYGLGVIEREAEGRRLVGHSGFFPGYLAEVWHEPDTGISAALMINTSHPPALGRRPTAMVDELLDVVRGFLASGAACQAQGRGVSAGPKPQAWTARSTAG